LANLKASLDSRRWLADPQHALTTDTWIEKRSALGIESFKAWEPVEAAFGMIDGIRRIEVASDTKRGDPIPPGAVPIIEKRVKVIEIARDELRAFGKVPDFQHEG
jgi:hypothetical protein